MATSVVPEYVDDISILLIDHDITSVTSLMSMLKQFSKKVISVDVASKALSMIEKQKKDIGLVIANIEMPDIDSLSFLTALLHKDIPLILINPEIKTKKPSDLLTKRACFSLDKPISENNIKNMWEHVLFKKKQELKEINVTENQEDVMDNDINQIEAFRASLKRQRTSQASLLGTRPFISTFTTFETYQQRKSIANVEWKAKTGCPIEIENKRKEGKKLDSNIKRPRSLWTNERHMKFLAAISILGEKKFLPKSILKIMNDPKLTHRQVASHLQKYKAQIEQISEILPRNEWKSTNKAFEYSPNYEYPFKASKLTKNLIASNSLWNSLRKKISSSSSITQFLFKKPIAERKKNTSKFHLEGKLDLNNHSFSGNVFNKSPMEVNYVPPTISNNPPYNILPTENANQPGIVSTGLSSERLPILSGLPSNDGASNTWTFQMESTKMSMNPFETDVNLIDLDLASIQDSFVPLEGLCTMDPKYTMNPFETNIDQMDWVPSTENHSHREIMNHMDWVPSTENNILPETDMNINFPFHEKNSNQMDWISSGEGYVPFENMIPSEMGINQMGIGYSGGSIIAQEKTNTNHVGYVSCGMHYEIPVLDNMVPLETNMEEMNYIPEDIDVPIEDLISFDFDVDEKDMAFWLEDNNFSERSNNLSSSYLDHDHAFRKPIDTTPHIIMEDLDHSVAMNLGSTRQQHNMMESCEYHNIEAVNQKDDMEGGNDFDDYRDCMDWIYQ